MVVNIAHPVLMRHSSHVQHHVRDRSRLRRVSDRDSVCGETAVGRSDEVGAKLSISERRSVTLRDRRRKQASCGLRCLGVEISRQSGFWARAGIGLRVDVRRQLVMLAIPDHGLRALRKHAGAAPSSLPENIDVVDLISRFRIRHFRLPSDPTSLTVADSGGQSLVVDRPTLPPHPAGPSCGSRRRRG